MAAPGAQFSEPGAVGTFLCDTCQKKKYASRTIHGAMGRIRFPTARAISFAYTGSPGGVIDSLSVLDQIADHAVSVLRGRVTEHLNQATKKPAKKVSSTRKRRP